MGAAASTDRPGTSERHPLPCWAVLKMLLLASVVPKAGLQGGPARFLEAFSLYLGNPGSHCKQVPSTTSTLAPSPAFPRPPPHTGGPLPCPAKGWEGLGQPHSLPTWSPASNGWEALMTPPLSRALLEKGPFLCLGASGKLEEEFHLAMWPHLLPGRLLIPAR